MLYQTPSAKLIARPPTFKTPEPPEMRVKHQRSDSFLPLVTTPASKTNFAQLSREIYQKWQKNPIKLEVKNPQHKTNNYISQLIIKKSQKRLFV